MAISLISARTRTETPEVAALRTAGLLSALVFLINCTFEVLVLNRLYAPQYFLIALLQWTLSVWAIVEVALIDRQKTPVPLRGMRIALFVQLLFGVIRHVPNLSEQVANAVEFSSGGNFDLEIAVIFIPIYLVQFLAVAKLLIDAFSYTEFLRANQLEEQIRAKEEAEQALVAAKDEAVAANLSKNQFLANMSHEIRTPMNGVIGLSHLLLESELQPEQRAYVWDIATSGEALLVLINDILDISKIEAGFMVFESQAFALSDVINSVLTAVRIKTQEKGIALLVDIPDATNLYVGDSLRIRQVLLNLIGNAVKFTDQGEVRLSVTDMRDCLRFEVKDSGVGIADDDLKKLFSNFVQVDASASRRYGGTGLGLSICKKLVEGMGGSIGVQSIAGQGSLFFFELPLQRATIETSPQAREVAKEPAHSAIVPPTALQVLLVEDHPINQKLALALLTRTGFLVDVAENGLQGVDAARSKRYAMIFMDVQMPVMNGFDAARMIRSDTGPNQHTPIIALTANAMQSDRDACMEAGMTDFLTKPFSKDGLASIIERNLR